MINPIKEEINNAIEIGCLEGRITQHINDMGIKIEGADVYEKNCRCCQKQAIVYWIPTAIVENWLHEFMMNISLV